MPTNKHFSMTRLKKKRKDRSKFSHVNITCRVLAHVPPIHTKLSYYSDFEKCTMLLRFNQ